ncbi:MAG TPA: hypothetical protein HA275_01300 [Halobacteriales archaeon]|uniref:hypothetical protein n=1 Tax=Candidatus Hikarchaeum yamanae TaxID=2675326 RepID=UPI0017CC7F56|nr:hypothetical protein [Halobacteriales archaeon]|tara:strand:+ start:1448 stop:2005 length:558 start_codon:yes stop_codon:yes gene_type:complete
MNDLPFPLDGSTLITGPSNTGKTMLTSQALSNWISKNGSENIIILEFGPEYSHNGKILGRHLSRFIDFPPDIWYGYLETYAPRAEGRDLTESMELAAINVERASFLLDTLPPHPTAVFVNDATIPLQSPSTNFETLVGYCDQADCAILNAFTGNELGYGDPISQSEISSISALENWADRCVTLPL